MMRQNSEKATFAATLAGRSTRPTAAAGFGTYRHCLLIALCLSAGACGDAPSADAESAAALLAAGKAEQAERQVKAELRSGEDDPALRLLLGRIYLAQGDGAAAFTAFERAADLGAEPGEVLGGMAESLVLQKRWAEALDLLGADATASLPPRLRRLRLFARLRVPLARPEGLFEDARALLAGETDSVAIEKLAAEPDVIAANAEHVLRAIAYASCRNPEGPAATGNLLPAPDWAELDTAGRRVLEVGPDEALKTPSAAARVARDGDIVEIAAGTYAGDVATWNARGLWLRAAGGLVILDSGGAVAEDMGIWVLRGDDTIVEGVRFVGAHSTHRNGSGIRLLARNLWVRHSEFDGNDDGILSFNEPGGEIVIEHSVFTGNGAGDGYSHNVYIGRTDRLVFRFNYSAGVRTGHLLKSRARENYLLYNRLADGPDGSSSYTIDLPEGGFALLLGNEIEQGPGTINRHMLMLGEEDSAGREHRFIFAYNTFYNHSFPATFIRDTTRAGVVLLNNVFAGAPANIDAASPMRAGNAFAATAGLVDPGTGNLGLAPSATFIDSGEALEDVDGIAVLPQFEYVHPAGGRRRTTVWRPDPGAHEFCGWPSPVTATAGSSGEGQ